MKTILSDNKNLILKKIFFSLKSLVYLVLLTKQYLCNSMFLFFVFCFCIEMACYLGENNDQLEITLWKIMFQIASQFDRFPTPEFHDSISETHLICIFSQLFGRKKQMNNNLFTIIFFPFNQHFQICLFNSNPPPNFIIFSLLYTIL